MPGPTGPVQVDLIVLNNGLAEDVIYGRAIVDSKYDPTTGKETDRTITDRLQ